MNLTPLVVYKVTKNSSDRKFEVGDRIWECKNGDIMCPNKGGWVDAMEYDLSPEMSDFEAVADEEYFVISTDSHERIMSFREIEKQILRQKIAVEKNVLEARIDA